MPRPLMRTCGVLLLALLLSWSVPGGTRLESQAASQLSEQDVEGIREVLKKLAAAFKKNDADSCVKLFIGDAFRREKLLKCLQREFQQGRYLEFDILQVFPDDTLRPNHHTVDVQFHFVLKRGDKEIENTTVCNFVVDKLDDGTFALVNSSFFEGLGLKSSMDMAIDRLMIIMILLAFMSFWVWMGYEAWRMRPRQWIWRSVVMVPLVGAFMFFFMKYLPEVVSRSPTTA